MGFCRFLVWESSTGTCGCPLFGSLKWSQGLSQHHHLRESLWRPLPNLFLGFFFSFRGKNKSGWSLGLGC